VFITLTIRQFAVGFNGRFASPFSLRRYSRTVVCHLNRFLFSPEEINTDENIPEVVLPKDDYRTIHASKVLGVRNGATIRAGLVSSEEHNGLMSDNAVIEWLPEGKVKKAEPLANGNPPGSLRIRLESLEPPQESMIPSVSLILALPRPLQLGRMLPMISQMGVDHLILTEARKVPKDYFGSHLFRKPEQLTERLVEGLCQAGDVKLPKVHVVRNLSNFLNNDLDKIFPAENYARVIAHPQRQTEEPPKRMREVSFPVGCPPRMVIAVGPEGGWEEPEELERFVDEHDFQQITMGSRVLRSDCAVVSLLSLAHDLCADF
jgi:RsmE family RNA methyltransferase